MTIAERIVVFVDLFPRKKSEKIEKRIEKFITDFVRPIVIIISLFVENVVAKENIILKKVVVEY